MTFRSPLAALTIAAAACGSASEPDLAPAVQQIEESEAERAVVARVNGRPVFADCVANQAAGHAVPPSAALQECIDFELLAQRAEADGWAADPDVAEVRKREAVRALLRNSFEPTFDGPEDVPVAHLEQVWRRPAVNYRFNHPEYRYAYYVRVDVPRSEPRGGPVDRQAERVVTAMYERMKDLELEPEEFRELAREVADPVEVAVNDKVYATAREGQSDVNFAEALFEIPGLNRVSRPARTRWGWDLILLVRIKAAQSHTAAQAEPRLRKELFPVARKDAFDRWLQDQLAPRKIEIDEARLANTVSIAGLDTALAPAAAPPSNNKPTDAPARPNTP